MKSWSNYYSFVANAAGCLPHPAVFRSRVEFFDASPNQTHLRPNRL
jgi:hypothetical protein